MAYDAAVKSDKYVGEHCYYSLSGGGNVLFMRGHTYYEDEIEAAKVLADHGYKVLMTPEIGGLWISKMDKKGKPKYVEGRIDAVKYEQSTINSDATNIPGAFNKALDHAVSKGAEYAVSFDRHNLSTKEDVKNGIAMFTKYPRNKNKIKKLFVITDHKLDVYEI